MVASWKQKMYLFFLSTLYHLQWSFENVVAGNSRDDGQHVRLCGAGPGLATHHDDLGRVPGVLRAAQRDQVPGRHPVWAFAVLAVLLSPLR